MRIVRVYDASRRPADWMEIIVPGQWAVFASLLAGGDPCDADGTPTTHSAATCGIADSLTEAETFCRERVERHPAVRFDVFDARGRAGPPVLTVVHPDRRRAIESDAGAWRRNRAIAATLIAAAPVLVWIDWYFVEIMVLPSLLAFHLVLFAMRLLLIDAGVTANERRRLDRVTGQEPGAPL